jgi:hypothetical protein
MGSGNESNTWTVSLFADIGTNELFVTRITIGLPEVLDATLYDNRDKIKEAIIGGVCMDCLLPAFISLRELRKTAADNQIPTLTKTKNFNEMCRNLWTAYRDRMTTAAKLMGYDLRFLFKKDSVFDSGCKAFLESNPDVNPELIARIRGNRTTWQPELMKFRNDYLEHKKIKDKDVVGVYSLESAESIFINVWVAIEEILVILLAAKLPPLFCLREIPESERNPHLPARFGFALVRPPTPR